MVRALLDSNQLWPVILAVVALGWAAAIAYVRPAVIAGVALGVFAFEAIFGSPPGLSVSGFLVYPRDGVFLAMALAAAARATTQPRSGARPDVAWWLFLVLVLISLGRGVQEFGANGAGNDFRGSFYVLAGVAYFASHRPERQLVRDVMDLWVGVAMVLVLVGFARVIGLRVGVAIDEQPFLAGRALYASPTLLVGQAALICFFAEPLASRWSRVRGVPSVLAYVLLGAVLILQHRTVWMTMLVSLTAMWTVLRPARPPDALPRSLVGFVVGTGVLILIFAAGGGRELQSDLARSAKTATSEKSTFLWRVEGWRSLLDAQGASEVRLLFGSPYGSGYERTVFGAAVNYSPHSWYVQTISRTGILGIGCLIALLWKLAHRARGAGLLPPNLGALFVLSAAVYGIAYQPPETQGVLLGLVFLAGRSAPKTNEGSDHPVPAVNARTVG